MAPFTKPAAIPVPNTAATPRAVSTGVPTTRMEATQFARMNTMPTERSRPPVSTTTVCAMATRASSTPLFAAVVATGTVRPTGWLVM